MRGLKMIHYHGLPITPNSAAIAAVSGGHAFISFAHPDQLGIAISVAQSWALDNGAFSAWRAGAPVKDWRPYFDFVAGLHRVPGFDWAVIPDVIDGDESDNDALLDQWPWPAGSGVGVPVWHMHESINRLQRLAAQWPRVAIGSSGEWSTVGNAAWWNRMAEAMNAICNRDGYPMCKLHGLRMLDPDVFVRLPLSSADSTNIGRNVGIDSRWRGTYPPPNKDVRAQVMRAHIEARQSAPFWERREFQAPLFERGAA